MSRIETKNRKGLKYILHGWTIYMYIKKWYEKFLISRYAGDWLGMDGPENCKIVGGKKFIKKFHHTKLMFFYAVFSCGRKFGKYKFKKFLHIQN